MTPIQIIKSIDVSNVDEKQTLLIFPIDFMRRHSPKHLATFQEVGLDTLVVRMVGPHEALVNRGYKLVTSKGASWASIPRAWLRNMGARVGDKLDLFTTADPSSLVLKHRKLTIV
jgi:hypothetical protein